MLIQPDFCPGADLGLNEGLEGEAGFELSLEIKGGSSLPSDVHQLHICGAPTCNSGVPTSVESRMMSYELIFLHITDLWSVRLLPVPARCDFKHICAPHSNSVGLD